MFLILLIARFFLYFNIQWLAHMGVVFKIYMYIG